ncbi:MAG: cytochrome-c peroxidase [bacterium]|jgi:cytochrome c peroxidase
MRGKFVILAVSVVAAIAVGSAFPATADDEALMKQANALFKPVPAKLATLKGKPLSPAQVELGKALFFDPRLSKSALISCNTCHNVGMGGADFQETSTGHGWQKGPRNAPTVLNAVFNNAQFWDGRSPDLKEQAKGPVQASVEMNNTPEAVVSTLKSMPGYGRMFAKAFPGEKDPVTFENMALAIENFEATLLTPGSRFDKFLEGKAGALSATEKRGLDKFVSKGCATCHGGINMGGTGYYKFGVVETPRAEVLAGDKGRFKVTSVAKDEFSFKSPSLRNIALTAPYFQSGKVWSLGEAVSIMGSTQLGISLAKADTQEIVAFLQTTTGVQPKVVYPILPESGVDTPKPILN